MRIASFVPWLAGLSLWSCLSFGCSNKPDKPTREECTQVAEHIADLIIANYTANADSWWDDVHADVAVNGGETGIPAEVQKPSFKVWLDSPVGKTWVLQRRGKTVTGVQQGIEPCMQNATKGQVKCLLAARSREEVIACDAKAGAKGPSPAVLPPAGSAGSAAPAGSGSSR